MWKILFFWVPNDSDYQHFFELLSLKITYLFADHPSAEIIFLSEINVHHKECLSSRKTYRQSRVAKTSRSSYFLQIATHNPNLLNLFPPRARQNHTTIGKYLSGS